MYGNGFYCHHCKQYTPHSRHHQQHRNNQATAGLNDQPAEPATAGGVATNIASDAASQAASNAMAKSGIPGAGVAGNVAGGLVKGMGGFFKKKPQPESPAPAEPTQP